jgi:V/A-type H+-transporting ATPase subunit E
MDGIENLLDKIISDGNEEIETIIKEAEREKESAVKKAKLDSEKFIRKSEAEAEKEAIAQQENYAAKANLELRDEALAKKQEIIDEAFKRAEERLEKLPWPVYEDFLKHSLAQMDFSGEEIIFLPKKYDYENLDEVRRFLSENGKDPGLKFSFERDIKNGFIVSREVVETNTTFKPLIDYKRSDLEFELVQVLG